MWHISWLWVCGQLWLTGKLWTWPTPLPLLIDIQYCSLFQIAKCLLWRQVPQSQDCAPCYTISRLCTMLRNLQIVHHVMQSPDCAPCYTISRLCTMLHHLKIVHHVTQSPDCLCNLGILRMCNAILRLHKFSDWAERIRYAKEHG